MVKAVAGLNSEIEKCRWVAEKWSTKWENWGNTKNMWKAFVANNDLNLTGSYNWKQWGHSGQAW